MDYSPLLEKLEHRLQGWKAKLISRAGKLQLVKTVLSAIPAYFMSCFKLPQWLLNRIDAMRRQFLWTRNENTHAIHLINWRTICLPIQCGGMGVVNLHLQNTALLLRWIWRLYANDHRLWASYISMIYAVRPTPDGPLILSKYVSFFWNYLLKLRPIFSSSTRFLIRLGKKVSFWFDNWSGQPIACFLAQTPPNRTISLYEAKHRAASLFPRSMSYLFDQAVQSLAHFTPAHGDDQIIWSLTASGRFSVKSIYKILSQGGKIRSNMTSIWKAAVTPSMRVFFYLFINNRLLTHEVMQRRNIPYQSGCVMCDSAQPEDIMHIFFSCVYAKQIWLRLSLVMGYNILTLKDSVTGTYLCSIPIDRDRRRQWTTMFITAVWFIWRERNERTFRNGRSPVSVLLNKIQQEGALYLRHC